MIDIKLVRENPGMFRKNLARRNNAELLEKFEELIKVDKKWRIDLEKLNELRHRKNVVTEEIAKLKKLGKDIKKGVHEAKEVPRKIKLLEKEVEKLEAKNRDLLLRIPNLLHESVPYGKDDTENVEIRRWGKEPKFNFEPKSHLDILINLGLIDAERAAKTAGTGFFYMKNELVLLDMAIQRFAFDFLRKKGYVAIWPPLMIHRRPYEGVTDLADFENVMYKIQNDDLYLIATSEHPMAAMYMDEVLMKKELPIKLIGISPCFRREVGAHGKYTKGMFRMHQFNKIEQFIFCMPGDSWRNHEELQQNSEKLYQLLDIPYRVVNICTGDIGIIAAKKYDIEALMAADGKYREVGSNSNCTDYQARRLNIRFREKEGQAPVGFVHTLNNTAIATSRTMIAIIENYQQKDGSVKIPDTLVPYMGGIKKLEKKEK